MHQVLIRDLNLSLTAESGQCFRMHPDGKGGCQVIARGRLLRVESLPEDRYLFHCHAEEYVSIWENYFDTGTDYARFFSSVDPGDSFLTRAVTFARGLRILRQEPWETLISFIISQRKSIPAIRHAVACLSERFGVEKTEGDQVFHAFPSPSALAEQGPERLGACALGYRTSYVHRTAIAVASGKFSLEALAGAGDAEMLESLMTLPGVGRKVAACVMLFGYHRLNAFPVDVWIDRVLKREYSDTFPFNRYEGFAGVLQQCMFCYARSLGPSCGTD